MYGSCGCVVVLGFEGFCVFCLSFLFLFSSEVVLGIVVYEVFGGVGVVVVVGVVSRGIFVYILVVF